MEELKSTIEVRKEGNVATLVVTNPPANTLSSMVASDLRKAFQEVVDDENIRVVVVTGSGDKFFAAGAEIKEFVEVNPQEGKRLSRNLHSTFKLIEESSKPVIAAINGYCLGAGLELALCCDIRYASKTALLGLPEINLGLIPGAGGTQRLPRMVGVGKAKELIFTGKPISAEEALDAQLVERVVSPDELMDVVKELASEIAKKSPLILSVVKETIDVGLTMTVGSGLVLETEKFGFCFSTHDKKEGVTAFIEKRSPSFVGR